MGKSSITADEPEAETGEVDKIFNDTDSVVRIRSASSRF
jgi:hypothetical protein